MIQTFSCRAAAVTEIWPYPNIALRLLTISCIVLRAPVFPYCNTDFGGLFSLEKKVCVEKCKKKGQDFSFSCLNNMSEFVALILLIALSFSLKCILLVENVLLHFFNFRYYSMKTYVVTPSLEPSRRDGSNDGSQNILMIGHKIHFNGEISIHVIIPKLSLIPVLSWSTDLQAQIEGSI